MSIPDHFPRRFSRAAPATAVPPDTITEAGAAGAQDLSPVNDETPGKGWLLPVLLAYPSVP